MQSCHRPLDKLKPSRQRQCMKMRDPWQPSLLVSAGVVLGAALGLSFAPVVSAVASDAWIGFGGSILGGIIGGGLTVFAGYLAWMGVQEQNDLTRESIEISKNAERRAAYQAVQEILYNIDASITYIDRILVTKTIERTVEDIYKDLYYVHDTCMAIGRFTEKISAPDSTREIIRRVYQLSVVIRIIADNSRTVDVAEHHVELLRDELHRLRDALLSE